MYGMVLGRMIYGTAMRSRFRGFCGLEFGVLRFADDFVVMCHTQTSKLFLFASILFSVVPPPSPVLLLATSFQFSCCYRTNTTPDELITTINCYYVTCYRFSFAGTC